MGHRLTKIYTRKGDDGTTVLGDTSRVPKDDLRIEAMGDIDELNSVLGIILSDANLTKNIHDCLTKIQNDLFDLGGEISIPNSEIIEASHIEYLETNIDQWNKDIPYLKEFILPGGHPSAAFCHLARTICRRAERRLFSLSQKQKINRQGFIYLNRLSDLLFVLARVINISHQTPEIFWKKNL